MPAESRPAFPTGYQAIALVIVLFLTEVLVGSLLVSANDVLALGDPALSALTVLLANGLVLSAVMHWAGISQRQLFHPAGHSVRAVLGLIVPPVLLSPWEAAMFEQMSTLSLPVVIITCLLAPVLEEMLFRGIILRGFLALYPRGQAILGSAILFGAAHLNLYQFFVALVIGSLAGWLYERSRSLLPGIALHAAYNSSLTLITAAQGTADAGPQGDPSVASWALALLAAALAGWALWRLLGRPQVPTAAVHPRSD
jgi:uncharacterized protein